MPHYYYNRTTTQYYVDLYAYMYLNNRGWLDDSGLVLHARLRKCVRYIVQTVYRNSRERTFFLHEWVFLILGLIGGAFSPPFGNESGRLFLQLAAPCDKVHVGELPGEPRTRRCR